MRNGWTGRLALAFSIGLAAAGAQAADLNQRNRLDDGTLGMPLDRMFKAKPNRSPYEPDGDGDERGFLPPMIPLTPPPAPARAADEVEPPPIGKPGGKKDP